LFFVFFVPSWQNRFWFWLVQTVYQYPPLISLVKLITLPFSSLITWYSFHLSLSICSKCQLFAGLANSLFTLRGNALAALAFSQVRIALKISYLRGQLSTDF